MRFAVDTEILLLWYIGAPLVIAAGLGWLALARRRASARAGAEPELYSRIAPGSAESVHRVRVWLAVLVVLALGLAAGRPQTGTRLGVATRHGIDLMLALDVSDSMRAEDLRPDRLEKARREALTLIELLDGDRVGVITFAGAAFVQCPLTLDYGAASMLLSAVETGTLPRPGTALGEAPAAVARDPFKDRVRREPVAQRGKMPVPLLVEDLDVRRRDRIEFRQRGDHGPPRAAAVAVARDRSR